MYSNFKIAHHKTKLEQIKQGELPLPTMVQWDLTNVCNLNCSFCFYKITPLGDWNPRQLMPTEIALRTLEELKTLGIKAIEWTGGGSIECHPNWKQILRCSQELGFENALVTNGTLLDKESLQIVKDFEWVRFSVDASTKKTYLKIKGVDFYEKAINSVKELLKVRSKSCVVGFSFIVCPENYKEIYLATKLAKDLGCDNIRFSLAYTPKREKLFDGIWEKCVEQIEKAKKEETDNFKVFAFQNRINELASRVLSKSCAYHHLVTAIAPAGVYPCCTLKDMTEYNFGKIDKDTTFKDIWFGERRRKFIKSIEKGCLWSCWHTEKNNFATYLMKDEPKHKNFP